MMVNWVFLIYYFLLFEEKRKNHNKHINNQNQEAFIVVIINYTFSVFLLCLLCKIIFFKKILTLRIKKYYFHFANRLTDFSLSRLWIRKINLVWPNVLFLELILCAILVTEEIEAHNLIQPFLLVSE